MITKERLEELIEQGATIYVVNNKVVFEEKINKHYTHDILKDCICWWGIPRKRWFFTDLFETKEEAEWVAKIHTERTEKFEPPFELKDNEKYKFTTAKGGKMSISKFVYKSGEVQWWLSYVGTHRTFYSYQEAVEYARKLFRGEKDE